MRPFTLRRIGVHHRAVAKDPAVHHQPDDSEQVERLRVVALAADVTEVRDDLVMAGVDAPQLAPHTACLADRTAPLFKASEVGRSVPLLWPHPAGSSRLGDSAPKASRSERGTRPP